MHNPTDQKVGGSNPSGRAPQTRCTAALSSVSDDLDARSHPNNHPNNAGHGAASRPRGASWHVRTVRHGMRFEVAGRCDGGAPVCGRCGSRWARTRSAGGPGSARSRCTAIGRRRRRPGNGGPRAQNCCGRPVARDRASPWPACCGSGWSPITGGDRQQWPVTGRRSVSWPWNRIGSRRAIDVGPAVLAAAITAWRADGWTDPTVWARVRALRSALGWAHVERILDRHPLEEVAPPASGWPARPAAGPPVIRTSMISTEVYLSS